MRHDPPSVNSWKRSRHDPHCRRPVALPRYDGPERFAVLRPGTIRVGDPVRLVRPTLEPPTERSDPDDQSR